MTEIRDEFGEFDSREQLIERAKDILVAYHEAIVGGKDEGEIQKIEFARNIINKELSDEERDQAQMRAQLVIGPAEDPNSPEMMDPRGLQDDLDRELRRTIEGDKREIGEE